MKASGSGDPEASIQGSVPVRGAGGAAEILGLKAATLESRMKKLGIRRPG